MLSLDTKSLKSKPNWEAIGTHLTLECSSNNERVDTLFWQSRVMSKKELSISKIITKYGLLVRICKL